MKLSIIIPVYNEEKTIAEVLRRIDHVKLPGYVKEIIIVDDGSTDKTVSVILNLKSRIKSIIFIEHKKNLGKGMAVRSGLMRATGNYIIIQDADLEYDPKEIPALLNAIKKNNAEVIYGTRLNRLPNLRRDERTPQFLLQYLGNRGLSFLTSILYGQWITDMETGYKLFSRKSIEGIKLYSRSFDFEPEITAKLLKKGYKIMEIPISTNPRGYKEGKKLNTLKDGPIALWTLLKYKLID